MASSLTASQAKINAITDMGIDVEKAQVAAEAEAIAKRAGKADLLHGAKMVNELAKVHVEADIEAGKVTVEQADLIRRWLVRACGVLESIANQREAEHLTANGKVVALQAMVKRLGAARDAAQRAHRELERRARELEHQPSLADLDPRRPPPGLAQSRKSQELQEGTTATSEDTTTP